MVRTGTGVRRARDTASSAAEAAGNGPSCCGRGGPRRRHPKARDLALRARRGAPNERADGEVRQGDRASSGPWPIVRARAKKKAGQATGAPENRETARAQGARASGNGPRTGTTDTVAAALPVELCTAPSLEANEQRPVAADADKAVAGWRRRRAGMVMMLRRRRISFLGRHRPSRPAASDGTMSQ